MPKDDPLAQNRTLWLDSSNMERAREAFFQRYLESTHSTHDGWTPSEELRAHRITWQIAWAAAVAAYDYMMNGRLEP